MASYQEIIKQAYHAFNERNIEKVLSLMHHDVNWPNGWEGGYLKGHNQVRDYWERQWKEIDPHVVPTSVKQQDDGRIDVEVHQLVKDMNGNELMNGRIKHIYTFLDGLITKMQIEEV